MEKSIENIWNQGFLDEGALLAPKINKLYEAKSINTIDKFRGMYHKNYWFIWVLLFINAVGSFIFTNIYLAVYMILQDKSDIKIFQRVDFNLHLCNTLTTH